MTEKEAETANHCEAAECYDIKYGQSYVPEDWNDGWRTKGKVGVTHMTMSTGKGPTEMDSEGSVPYKERAGYAINVDKSLYYSYQLYKECAQQYNVYAMKASDNNYYPYGASFMEWLMDGKRVDFEKIENDIYYLLDSGSAVIDEIGYGDDYNFDFVDDAADLKLTVGGEELNVSRLGDNEKGDADSAYGFGKTDEGYRFVLKYYRNGFAFGNHEYQECFKWEITRAGKNICTGTADLHSKTDRSSESSRNYGQYDKDGSRLYDLYTNNQAVLYPVNSSGEQETAEYFNKPTVSYTVSATGPEIDPQDPGNMNEDVPKTGDAAAIYGFASIFLLILSALGGTMLRCTKKQRD